MTWRPASREDRQVAWLWAYCAGCVVLLWPVWRLALPFAPECLWHAWTGFACPTCGATRAVRLLLRADASGAFAMNPLVTAASVGFVVGGLAAPVWTGVVRAVPEIPPGPKPSWAIAAAIAIGTNWVWLISRGV